MSRIPLTKEELRNRNIPVVLFRNAIATYYEEDGQIFCERSFRSGGNLGTLVLRLGNSPLTGQLGVYWDRA